MIRNNEVENSSTISGNIGFIGAGNMAQAIGERLLKTGVIKSSQLYISAPSQRNFNIWITLGVTTTNDNGFIVNNSDIIFLAMKPHLLDNAIDGIMPTFTSPIPNKLFVSLLAGVTLEVLQQKLSRVTPNPRVIRVMPNTPMMVGAGCSVFCCGQNANAQDAAIVRAVLSAGGICDMVPETIMNAVGGLTGCGPAFVYMMIEALSDGAVKMGVPRTMATQFAAQTMLGSAKMVLETGKHPGQLKDEVCSPGGTTITGIHAMERAKVSFLQINTLQGHSRLTIKERLLKNCYLMENEAFLACIVTCFHHFEPESKR